MVINFSVDSTYYSLDEYNKTRFQKLSSNYHKVEYIIITRSVESDSKIAKK